MLPTTFTRNNGRARRARRVPAGIIVALVFAVVVLSYLAVLYAGVLSRSSPQGAIDYPEEGSTITDAVDLRGWAVDTAASGGTGVDRVQVSMDEHSLGDAAYGSARPEVEAKFGRNFGPSGWSIRLDPGTAAPGQHQLTARVHSSAVFWVTSAEATPLENPLAEAADGRAAATAAAASRQRARDMGRLYLPGYGPCHG